MDPDNPVSILECHRLLRRLRLVLSSCFPFSPLRHFWEKIKEAGRQRSTDGLVHFPDDRKTTTTTYLSPRFPGQFFV